MPRIRITGRLPQAGLGLQTTPTTTMAPQINGPGDDLWIRQIMQYEQDQGGYNNKTGKSFGLPNWGYNSRLPLNEKGTIKNPINPITKKPWQMGDAINYFKQDILPQVQNFPMGLRERLADYKYNTGRSINDLLLYNAGKITLDDLNSNKTFDKEWEQHKDEIQKMYSDPNFINKLDESKDAVYRTTGSYSDPSASDPNKRTHYSINNPNPAYGSTWKGRTTMFSKVPTTTSSTPASTPTPVVTANGPQVPKQNDEDIDYASKLPNFTKMIGQKYGKPQTTTQTSTAPSQTTDSDGVPTISFKRPTPEQEDAQFAADKQQMIDDMSPKEKAQYDKENAPLPEYNPFSDIGNKSDKETDQYNAMGYRKQKRFDRGLLNKQDTEAQRQQYQDWYNKKYPMSKHGALREPLRVAGSAMVNMLGKGVDYVQNVRTQKQYDENEASSNLTDNAQTVTPQGESGNRGNWDKNTGIFRPNELGAKNETMYGAYGGTIPTNNNAMGNKIKIRITGSPEQQKMAYGGQLGYSLNLGAKRLYTDMPDAKSDNVSSTIQAVPRDEANIEAEKGETIYGDMDGDGAAEHMVIGGKRHTEGGTPLNAPEGSFIFSDTAKMKIKDPKVLEKFGISPRKEGWTPAEIAKRYDINKYKAIMEDPQADPIRKATAQIMIKNYTKKLSELALIQEQMKGFPQGIPDIAKKANPELKTKEDQNIQDGLSENLNAPQEQQPQPGGPEPNGVQEYPEGEEPQPQQPGMAYGGMIPQFALAGQVDDYSDVVTPYAFTIPNYAAGETSVNTGTAPAATVNNEVQVAGPGDPNAIDQTYTPKQRADFNDPEYPKFLALMKKADTGKYKKKGAIYVNKLDPTDAAEFARLATKFGFKRDASGNVGGYRIIQGATPGYSMTDTKTKKQFGFFGGFSPDMYEKKVIEDVYGKEASDKMTDVERRKAYFKELGIDITNIKDAQFANPKTLYGNQKFFKEKFYPAFSKTFAKEGFRPEMGDDMLIGAEHYDSYKTKPIPEDKSITGFKCTGRDANGQPQIISSTYIDAAAMAADGAVSSDAAAQAQCPATTTTIVPNKIPPGKKRPSPWDYMTPDIVNFFASAAVPPKKYLPWSPRIAFEPGKIAFEDWRAKAAERQSLMNNMMGQMNTYAPSSATAANLSFLAGQGAEGLVGDIAATDARNVATANAFNQSELQRRDQNNLLNLKQAQDMYNGNVIANQQYDNAQRTYINDMAKTFGQAWKNRMYLGMLNAVNPIYNVDPRSGYSFFKEGYGTDKLGNFTGAGGGTGNWASINNDYQSAKQQIPGLTFDQYLKLQGKKSTSDTDMDGLPNSTRTSGYASNAGSAMPSMYMNAFGNTMPG